MGRSSLRRISRQPRTWLAALRVGLWVGSIALSVSAEPTRSFPPTEPADSADDTPGVPAQASTATPADPGAPEASQHPPAGEAQAPAAAPGVPGQYSYPPGSTPGLLYTGPVAPGAGANSGGSQRDQGATDGSGDAAAKAQNVSINLSLLQLIGPLAEGSFELRLANHVGLAAVIGHGRFLVNGEDSSMWEGGGQLNIYASDFEGLVGTAEVLHLTGEGESDGSHFTGTGKLFSALIGYKGIRRGGFTAVVQGGLSGLLTEISSGSGRRQRDAYWAPALNFSIGLSL